MDKPLISIAVLAYNLEKYVDECLESLVAQKFEHPYEIVIGEDFSTDNTRRICLSWQERYPEIVRVLPRSKNLGMAKNFADIINQCRGSFIAFCEADDFWCNPFKLKLQYDYLTKHPEMGLVHTNFKMIDEERKNVPKLNKKLPEGRVLRNLLEYSFIATVTVMMRKVIIEKALSEKQEIILGNGKSVDHPLWLTCATFTKIGYLDEVTATYRIMRESASHSRNMKKQIEYQTVNKNISLLFQQQYFPEDEKLQKAILSTYYYVIMKESIRALDKKTMWQYYLLLVKTDFKKLFSPKTGFFLLKGFFLTRNIS